MSMSPSLFSYSIASTDGRTTLSLRGELDMSCTIELEAITGALSSFEGTDLVVDLSELSFLDSTGLSYLLKARETLRQRGKRVQVVGAHGGVLKVIKVTGLTDVLNVVR